ncbi:hypothetical protein JOC34_000481 [Virgibacillus halotolerans]|uniref:hypothetical protein n=1 Tax=Virgibacillus halotolerans TaxID=1071053 RepID=UPI001960AA73|nr:hypothetical protein [Virgibacillus halotolerans]MBM7598124.1 hypothetical protein [Virgibacillus halotolerans]
MNKEINFIDPYENKISLIVNNGSVTFKAFGRETLHPAFMINDIIEVLENDYNCKMLANIA